MSAEAHAAWRRIAEHYAKLARERADDGPAVQLACLVLADYCVHLWSGSGGGPSLPMVALAEHLLGERVDIVVATELAKIAAAKQEALS